MIPASVGIFVCTEAQDMRRSFDGLARAAREVLDQDPQGGSLFCFVNKRANHLQKLWWGRNGYCLLYKRLHRANFVMPHVDDGGLPVTDSKQLARLLAGVPQRHPVGVPWTRAIRAGPLVLLSVSTDGWLLCANNFETSHLPRPL